MALVKELECKCSKCGKTFMRKRRLLDNNYTLPTNLVCPGCRKPKMRRPNLKTDKPVEIKAKKPRARAAIHGKGKPVNERTKSR